MDEMLPSQAMCSWVFGEKNICDHCLCIHILIGGYEKTPLVPDVEPADFLPQLPLEDH